MARPRSAGFEGQRAQILAAAAQLFAARGYTAATMTDVAAACGVSKATLYHYVRDKHGLLALITRSHVSPLEALVQAVKEQGLAPQAGDATTAVITIVRDGLSCDVAFQPSDDSILAAAGRAGLEVPYSCRSGVCATCRAKVLQGRVRMDRNFALEKADLDAGFVLTCQAHPLTDRVVVSFDER